MIFVGIDDTDTVETPGTNQLARALVRAVADDYRLVRITRHQLLFDPRVPYTSKNGSASILLEPRRQSDTAHLIPRLRDVMRAQFVPGSDPGLCVATAVCSAVVDFGRRCQRDVVPQSDARELAAALGIHLEGLGGTEQGVVGALAAIGLASTGDDGRVVQFGEWPDDLSGPVPIERLHERMVVVREQESGDAVTAGVIDVGKHLRPNCRGGKVVLFVRRAGDPGWEAVKLS
jgi:hypothetical protein